METIISRKEAISLGKTHFFTGVPCKYNHISKRYVSTQSCVECLHPSYANFDMESAKLYRANAKANSRLLRDIRASERLKMITIRLKIRAEDVNLLYAIVLAFAQVHVPQFIQSDIQTRFKPKYFGNNMNVYEVRCFVEDTQALRFFAEELCSPYIQSTPERQPQIVTQVPPTRRKKQSPQIQPGEDLRLPTDNPR